MARKRELHDAYFRKAKADGYVARSAYKLLEIQERHHIIKPGMAVIDLGCAPGSWLQVVANILSKRGPGKHSARLAGIDLQPIDIPLPDFARTRVADIFSLTSQDLLDLLGVPQADVVLSDMAPSTTGDPGGDHFKSVEMCRRVLELVPTILRPGGSLAMKVFEGEDYPALLRETQKLFSYAKGLKPDATRDVSREMFIIGEDYLSPMSFGPIGLGRARNKPKPEPTPQQLAQNKARPTLAPKRPKPSSGWST
jgi:23S rRNA (uridine2552-2'-O)-methyltransferase